MSAMARFLRLMVEKKASDLFLSANAPAHIKINGVTVPINNQVLEDGHPLQLLSEVQSPEKIALLKETGELNNGFSLEGVGNFRISAMHQRGTVAIVIRYINHVIPSLESLNLPTHLAQLAQDKRGLVLLVGATGTGKSTTLAAMIEQRNLTTPGHILTIEDPIEFRFQNKKSFINQREVGVDTRSLHTALRNALRQAPDIIMIGEIRDRETMEAAINYALSGHLCLATLHANNSYHALNRILNFYPVEVRPTLQGDLASALNAIVSQRLIRTPKLNLVPAVEVMMNTQLIKDLIEAGDFGQIRDAMEKSLTQESQTFEQDLARLIEAGIIDEKVGLANADSPTNLTWRLQNRATKLNQVKEMDPDDSPSFSSIKLDMRTMR